MGHARPCLPSQPPLGAGDNRSESFSTYQSCKTCGRARGSTTAASVLAQRTSAFFGCASVKLGIARPASQVLCRTSGILLAPAAVGAALEERPGQLGRLLIVACSNAFLMLTSVQAAGPPDLKVEPAMTAAAEGSVDASPQAFPMEEFLDRLMAAESGGRQYKKNPRSTASARFNSSKPHSSLW